MFLDELTFVDDPSHEFDDGPSFVESDARIKELDDLINSDPALGMFDAAVSQAGSPIWDVIWAAAG